MGVILRIEVNENFYLFVLGKAFPTKRDPGETKSKNMASPTMLYVANG